MTLFLCVEVLMVDFLMFRCIDIVLGIGPCTFEKDKCGWTQDTSDVFDWSSRKGRTPSSSTGPTGDHTVGTLTGEWKTLMWLSRKP